MNLEPVTYEARFHILENLLLDALTDLTQKLSQFCESEVLFLVQSSSNGRRVAGSPSLCQSFLNEQLLSNGEEETGDFSTHPPPDEPPDCTPDVETIVDTSPSVETSKTPPPLISMRKRVACTTIDDERRPSMKISKLTAAAVKMEALDPSMSAPIHGVDHQHHHPPHIPAVGIMMDESGEEAVGKLLDHFLHSSSKAEAIRQSSDPSIFEKSSVMYKLFSSLIWDYSKECAKVLPFDERCKPLLTSFAFDLLWNFFPAFEFYDNSPSINSGGCFRSPRGFFKNMFCNRLKDQTTRKKR